LTPIHPDKIPSLVYANKRGEIIDFPDLTMAGRNGNQFLEPDLEELIPLPEGSELFTLPARLPVAIDPASGEPVKLVEDPQRPGEKIQAVAAFMAPAHTAIHTAAFQREKASTSPLPLFAYTAVGWHKGRFWVSAFRSDSDCRQDADQFDQHEITRKTIKKLKKHRDNRLIQHLGKCCLTYGCPAAGNYFLGRWEAPLPSSPACNADCIGCISLQPSGCCPATQDRITFIPTAEEIAEIAVSHLNSAPRPVVSFGQGCEGEPLLQAETLEKAIKLIRSQTTKGTINLNSNSSLPNAVKKLSKAGLDSIRVSMSSARKEYHSRYYRPRGFDFDDVCRSIAAMKEDGRFVSLNYFILPGFTDDPSEYEALTDLVEKYRPDFIQLRNLNMDPDYYFDSLQYSHPRKTLGIRKWFAMIQKDFPKLKFGYFNPPLR
jgi:wyosine [tRNA(Phe)-imidazoG37] synthetase (radical SAM superfamily)